MWRTLARPEAEPRDLPGSIATRFHDFSDLDERLHRLINSASGNRFILDFHDIIALIFHHHYQWASPMNASATQAPLPNISTISRR